MFLIGCDLDRTLLPNGKEPDDGSLGLFYEMLSDVPGALLVYVSGRNLPLLQEGIRDFGLHLPDYFIGSVGTEVFKNTNGTLTLHPTWIEYLKHMHPTWDRDMIVSEILTDEQFFLQEDEVQNPYKISYYIKGEASKESHIRRTHEVIQKHAIEAEIVYSIDPLKNIGLLDILPRYATKVGALNFLVNETSTPASNVVYCGDSGNDLLPLTSGYKAILVNNAPDEVKAEAIRLTQEKSYEHVLYIASGLGDLNGNYASGVIEGLIHFGVFENPEN